MYAPVISSWKLPQDGYWKLLYMVISAHVCSGHSILNEVNHLQHIYHRHLSYVAEFFSFHGKRFIFTNFNSHLAFK
jgi:hypothetical protein